MKPEFFVEVLKFDELNEIDGIWQDKDFIHILNTLEYGDTADLTGQELREMCLLSLQDLLPERAAEIILQLHFGNILKAGQIQNIAREMLDEKLWEEYADISMHERFFHVGALLHEIFPRTVPEPDAICVSLKIKPMNKISEAILSNEANESFYVRLVADGIDNTSALNRVFEDQLAGRSFAEAEHIIWIFSEIDQTNASKTVQLIGSGAWFAALSTTRSYSSNAYPDD